MINWEELEEALAKYKKNPRGITGEIYHRGAPHVRLFTQESETIGHDLFTAFYLFELIEEALKNREAGETVANRESQFAEEVIKLRADNESLQRSLDVYVELNNLKDEWLKTKGM